MNLRDVCSVWVVTSALACLGLGASVHAADLKAPAAKEVLERVRQTMSNLPADTAVQESPVPGLYELRIEKDVVYVDATARFVLKGELFDNQTQTNLTEARVNELLRVPFEQLPRQDGFDIVRGKGKRHLVIFEDPNCGYCKRLERDLIKLDDVRITVNLIPILGADSMAKSKAIWCSADRAATWIAWMTKGVAPKSSSECDTSAIERNLAFANRVKVNGTPALFFADGSRVPGAIGLDEIEKRLKALHP